MPPVQPLTDGIPRSGPASAVLHAGFVAAGVVTVLLGPILPILIARWSLSDERAGLFFTAQFGGSMAGVASLSTLIRRRGYRLTFLIGFTSVMLGVAGLNLGSALVGLLATAGFGYGLGLVLPATNLWVAEVAASRAAALNILNLAWGIGAVACSPLVMLAQRGDALALLLFGIAGFSGLIALILATMKVEPRSQENGCSPSPPATKTVSKQTAFALGALFFLYIGSENSVAGWAAAYAKRMQTAPGDLWAITPVFFWGGLLAGRALAPIILLRVGEKTLMAIGLAVAAVGNGALLRVTTFRGAGTCFAATGLGLACIYPLLVASLVGYYGQRARRTGSVMFALAGLGGATLPWLVGLASTQAGGLRAGLLVPIAACLAMISLLALLRPQPST